MDALGFDVSSVRVLEPLEGAPPGTGARRARRAAGCRPGGRAMRDGLGGGG